MGLSAKQLEFVQTIVSRKYRHHLFGGGRSCGKTIVSLGLLDELCQQYPNVRFAVVRKSLATIRRNTIPSFEKILNMNGNSNRAELNKTDWMYHYKNKSEIVFIEGNISNDPTLNKMRGLEVTGFAIEEVNEVDQQVFTAMQLTWGRWNNRLYNIPPFSVLTCNPDNNWVKDEFYTPWTEGKLGKGKYKDYYFMPALPHDNPHNDPTFLANLETLPEAEYQRYVKGNWEYSSDPNQMIQYAWIRDAEEFEEDTDTSQADYRKPQYVGVDVAREGNDYTVLYYADDRGLMHKERYSGLKTHEVGNLLITRIKEFDLDPDNISIDAIGLGAGVIDYLESKRIYVTPFKSSEGPMSETTHYAFANRRIEAAWMLREELRLGKISIKSNSEFVRQALQLKYFVKENKIIMESKEAIKKRLGKSPDEAEAAIMANWSRLRHIHNTLSFRYASNLTKQSKSTMVNLYKTAMSPRQTVKSEMVY